MIAAGGCWRPSVTKANAAGGLDNCFSRRLSPPFAKLQNNKAPRSSFHRPQHSASESPSSLPFATQPHRPHDVASKGRASLPYKPLSHTGHRMLLN